MNPQPASQMQGTPVAGPAYVPRRGSYGIDAPCAFGAIGVLVVACCVVAIVSAVKSARLGPLLPALFMASLATFIFHTTLRGKFVVWSRLLDKLALRGDERILDLGCGRGAVLLLAAQRLTTGRAVGVDVWRSADQSGNSAEATRRNAIAEGVADRVELHTADLTALPFTGNSFDVVVASLAIHNLSGRASREKAITEAVRVLRPGGRLLIADVRGSWHYRDQLAKSGMTALVHRRLGWQFWWGGPWASTRLVTATKPDRRN